MDIREIIARRVKRAGFPYLMDTPACKASVDLSDECCKKCESAEGCKLASDILMAMMACAMAGGPDAPKIKTAIKFVMEREEECIEEILKARSDVKI